MRGTALLAWNTVREAAAARLGAGVAIFAVALVTAALGLGALAVDDPARVTRDVGVAGLDLGGAALAIALAVTLIARELEGGSADAALTRGIARGQLVLARWLGVEIALAASMAALAAVVVLLLAAQGVRPDAELAQRIWLAVVGASVAGAVATLLATLARPLPAAAYSGALFVIGRSVPELRLLARRTGSGVAATALGLLAHLLPNFQLLAGSATRASQVLWATIYAAGYALAAIALATIVVRRRDFV
jgi:ABC-type transport system involved in multi-copper enzyme maturation permease subunit